MNTHETYVNLETAKLLKQAGFDWKCACYYTGINDKIHIPNNGVIGFMKKYEELFRNHNETISPIYSAPILDVAQKWLREVKKIHIEITFGGKWIYTLYNLTNLECLLSKDEFPETRNYNTYEEAQEAGIQKCLILLLGEKK